ncbi:MAG TPA: Crp/Fnr family transcriptional regulator [Saprospiraceae bacterium]|nr:Crp/Fnr family transcriptional regulator [Saprospiraceae bacterium]
MNLYEFFCLFHPITPDEFQIMEDQFVHIHSKKGTFLTRSGEIQKNLYFVQSGYQMSYFETEEKSTVMAFTYSPGLCAIPDSFFNQTPARYDLCCLTDSEFSVISRDKLEKIFDRSQNIERLFRKMTEQILCGLIERHLERNTLNMEERFLKFCKRSPHLLNIIPHKYLASYLGIDPTNFSKLFNSVKI